MQGTISSRSRKLILAGQISLIGITLITCEYLVDRGVVAPLYLAAPSQIVTELAALFKDPAFFRHCGVTLLEFLVGFFCAAMVGTGFGLWIARVEVVDRLTRPFIAGLMSIPTVAIIPLIIIWLGLGIASKIVFVFLFSVFSILYNTVAGIRETPPNLLKVAQVFGARQSQIIHKVLFPSAMPTIFAGFRVAAAHGLIGALFGEMLASEQGLGNLLKRASTIYNMGAMIALALMVTALAVLILHCLDWAERRFFLRWKFK